MCQATGVERRCALRARAHGLISLDRQLRPTHPAEDGGLTPLLARPLFRWVIGAFRVAQMARIVPVAAGKANGDDVEFGRVVLAPCMRIDRLAEDARSSSHCTAAFCY